MQALASKGGAACRPIGRQMCAPRRGSQPRSRVPKVRALPNPLFDVAEDGLITLESLQGSVSDAAPVVEEIVVESTPSVTPEVVETVKEVVTAAPVPPPEVVEAVGGAASILDAIPGGAVGAGVIAASLIGVPTALYFLVKGNGIQALSPARAFNALAESDDAVLVDLRTKASEKEFGTPDLRSTGKRAYRRAVNPEDAPPDASYFPRLKGREESLVILLDSFGDVAVRVGNALRQEGFVNVAYVVGGAEGPRGWLASEMPWRKGNGIVGAIVENIQENPTPWLVVGGLGVGAGALIESGASLESLALLGLGIGLSQLSSGKSAGTIKVVAKKPAPVVETPPAPAAIEAPPTPPPPPPPSPMPEEAKEEEEQEVVVETPAPVSSEAPAATEADAGSDLASQRVEAQRWIDSWRARTAEGGAEAKGPEMQEEKEAELKWVGEP